ncbi:MAG: PD40 domain-containing protein [Bradymonadales bacterium]|nr:PD40 domain-containing protein [Bradymonadales bacterium]
MVTGSAGCRCFIGERGGHILTGLRLAVGLFVFCAFTAPALAAPSSLGTGTKSGERTSLRQEQHASIEPGEQPLSPLEVISLVSEELEVVSSGACLPDRFFASYSGQSARRIEYRSGVGRVEALVSCQQQAMVRLEIYPNGQEDLRYLVLFEEATVAVEHMATEPAGWRRQCDGSECAGGLDRATAESWRRELADVSRVASAVQELAATWRVPRGGVRPAPALPLFNAGGAPHPVVFARQGRIWRIVPDGSEALDTGISVAPPSNVIRVGGRFSHGSEAPALSPDRRQLAYLEGGSLYISDLEGGEPEEVLSSREGRRAIVINSWTPDGQGLLAYVEDTRSHRGGYRRVDGDSHRASELSLEDRAIVWSADGSAVLFDRATNRGFTLYREPISGGSAEAIATSTGCNAFRPLSAAAGVLAYLEDNNLCTLPDRGGRSEIVARSEGNAEFIRPVVSPDGTRVAFFWERPDRDGLVHLAVVELESREIRRVTPCTNRCEFQWYDPEHLLFTDSQGRLVLVDLEGQEMQLSQGARLVGIGRPM